MTKNQLSSLYNLILGMGFLIIGHLILLAGKAPSWVAYVLTGIAVFHLIVAGSQRISQQYDENGKPL